MRKRRKPITEDDELKAAKERMDHFSKFIDNELERWIAGKIDKPMMAAAMEGFMAACQQYFQIENRRWHARLKREGDEMKRQELWRLQEQERHEKV
jgi:hypothetical protein